MVMTTVVVIGWNFVVCCVTVDEFHSCMTMAIAFFILHVLQRLNSVKLIATCVLVLIVVIDFFYFLNQRV